MEYYKNLDLSDIKYFCEFDLIWKVEQWKEIEGYSNKYQVSDLGRIKSLNYRRKGISSIRKQGLNTGGYLTLLLCDKGLCETRTAHQLVAISFLGHIPCGFDLVVNHKNFIRTDNRKLNLEIVTNRENTNKNNVSATSKFIGVYWLKSRRKWVARIRIGKEHKYLGIFKNQEDASKAYNDKLNEIIKKIK